MKTISKTIISACGHIGTHKFNWQPESERFAIGYRSNILIYDLASTSFYLNRAIKFVEKVIIKFGRIYFYGLDSYKDKKFIKNYVIINQVVTHKSWKGGFVTNVRRFKSKIKNARKRFSAVVSFNYSYKNYSLPKEAYLVGLPSVSVVDSNVKAENFNYPIPINADTFAITRMVAYNFGLYVFKGISRRIISRFSKKLKIIKVKKLRKKKLILKNYFTNKKKINPTEIIQLTKKFQFYQKRAKWYQIAEEVYNNYILNKKSKQAIVKLYALGFPIRKPWQMNRKQWLKKKSSINIIRSGLSNNKMQFSKKWNKEKRTRRRIRIKARKIINNFSKLKNKMRKVYKINKFKDKFIKLLQNNSNFITKNFKSTIKLYKYHNFCEYLQKIKIQYINVKKQDNVKKKIRISNPRKDVKKHRYYYHNFNFHKKIKKKKPFFFKI